MVDYEGEIAVLIGRAGRDIPVGSGWDHVAGLTVANDVSARDVQLAGMANGQVTDPREDHPRQDVSQLQTARPVRGHH